MQADADLSGFLGAELVRAMCAVRRAEEKRFSGGGGLDDEVATLMLRY